MKYEMRLMLSLVAAAALGLSCTACLAPSALNDTAQTSVSTTLYAQSDQTDTDLIHTGMTSPVSLSPVLNESVRRQNQTQLQSSVARPLGEANGIDLAVAGFTQSLTEIPAYRSRNTFTPEYEDRQRFDASYTLYANSDQTGLGLDLSVSPHISFDEVGNMQSTRAGAEVRIGYDLDRRGKSTKNSNWYLFAGADGEALVWDVQRARTRGIADGQLTLQDQVTVGDVQAGVGWETNAGHMSVSYIEREYHYKNGAIARTGEEDFVALTLSWRR
ncbi:MAG: hypothetical protein CMK09_10915 [Ponticaulis sp.]|nr:hypothetical protein [Ponticaulis sp.]|tara:strand:- start:11185 stop:12003 length:819 start_codon:yes stop_codon:yes gene_type:complete